MNIKKDPQTGVIYLRLRPGRSTDQEGVVRGLVEETLEVEDGVYLDLDDEGRTIGMEFLTIANFNSFLDKYPEGIEILDRVEDRSTIPLSSG